MNFNSEQLDILNAKERIVVVSACPGSGKTSVFVEKLRRLQNQWNQPRRGIAALSFTNAASSEIGERLGLLNAPHFLGTLDSFMLRFVVQPFSHLVGVLNSGPRLVPAPLDERLEFPKLKYGSANGDLISIYKVNIVGGSMSSPICSFKHPQRGESIRLSSELSNKALTIKRQCWQRNGYITHGDSNFIAAQILTDSKIGTICSRLIGERFPIILVDEFQDTMHFLSKALFALLENSVVSAMLVGDPDQAIYEFGGASPHLFSDALNLEGSQLYSITKSQRFGKAIAVITSALSESAKEIVGNERATDGFTRILIHQLEDNQLDSSLARQLLSRLPQQDSSVILARNSRIVRLLSPASNKSAFQGRSKAGRTIDSAVSNLRSGDMTGAMNIVSQLLWMFITDKPALPTDSELEEIQVSRAEWRIYVFTILIEASKFVESEVWNDWLKRVMREFEKAIISMQQPFNAGRNFQSDKTDGTQPRVQNVITKSLIQENSKVITVHQAKGTEYDHIVYFLNKAHATHSPCISQEWWKTIPSEERRIGFVAISRPRKSLTLCLHKNSYGQILKVGKGFVDNFSEVADL